MNRPHRPLTTPSQRLVCDDKIAQKVKEDLHLLAFIKQEAQASWQDERALAEIVVAIFQNLGRS
jgi:hypothetical protein